MAKKQVGTKDFYPIAYAGLLGGAAHAITDSYLVTMLPTEVMESIGLSIKDLVLIYLGVYASKNHATKAWQKQALEGMSTIAVYKTLYPKFLEPTITNWLAGA